MNNIQFEKLIVNAVIEYNLRSLDEINPLILKGLIIPRSDSWQRYIKPDSFQEYASRMGLTSLARLADIVLPINTGLISPEFLSKGDITTRIVTGLAIGYIGQLDERPNFNTFHIYKEPEVYSRTFKYDKQVIPIL